MSPSARIKNEGNVKADQEQRETAGQIGQPITCSARRTPRQPEVGPQADKWEDKSPVWEFVNDSYCIVHGCLSGIMRVLVDTAMWNFYTNLRRTLLLEPLVL